MNKQFLSKIAEKTLQPFYPDFYHMLNNELARVRRFERALSIIIVKKKLKFETYEKPSTNSQIIDPQYTTDARYKEIIDNSLSEIISWSRVIQNSIREIDKFAYDEKRHQFIAFFPETNKAEAYNVIKRMKKNIRSLNESANHFGYGIAEFPENGLIVEDLIKHAEYDGFISNQFEEIKN